MMSRTRSNVPTSVTLGSYTDAITPAFTWAFMDSFPGWMMTTQLIPTTTAMTVVADQYDNARQASRPLSRGGSSARPGHRGSD